MNTRRTLLLLPGWLALAFCNQVLAQLPPPAEPLPPPPPEVGSRFDPSAEGITVLPTVDRPSAFNIHELDLCRFATPFLIGGPKGPGVFNGTGGWAIDSPRFIQDLAGTDQVRFRFCLNFVPAIGSFSRVYVIFGANPWGLDPPVAFDLSGLAALHAAQGLPQPFPSGVWAFNVVLIGADQTVLDAVDPLLVTGFSAPPPQGSAPRCAITRSGTRDGKKFIEVTARATNGLAALAVLKSQNADVNVPAFEEGATHPVTVTATRIDQSRRTVVELGVYDVEGNKTTCDPLLTTLSAEAPEGFGLDQNYPNPFNPSTLLRFRIAATAPVALEVFDVLGRRVATLLDEVLEAGAYEARWDGTNEAGQALAGGVYVYRLKAGAFTEMRTMTLLR